MISNILSVIEVLLVFTWLIEYVGLGARGFVHIFLIIAVLIIAMRMMRNKIIV